MATGTVASARYSIPHDTPVATSPTNLDKTNNGRQDSASPARDSRAASVADMSEGWNPNALPFRPGGFEQGHREQFFNGFPNQPPPPPPPPQYPPPGFRNFQDAPWNPNFAPPPPPPPQFFQSNQHAYFAAQADAQARAQHNQWAQQHGHQGYQQGPPPFGMHHYGPPSHHGPPPPFSGPPPYAQHRQPNFPPQAYPQMAMQSQGRAPYGGSNEDIQYAFDALIKGLKNRKSLTNLRSRVSTPSGKKSKSGAATNGQSKQKGISGLNEPASSKKGRYGDDKIMLPAPQPTPEYLAQAAEAPTAVDTPNNILVILDLNGTVLHRPNKNAKVMIERPFLKPFLRYLFSNFKVMVWSSAKPDNVKSLVNQSLDNSLRSQLVVQWGRDSFGLSPTNYNQNVQVYKNLKLVWSRDVIQQHHPEYATGGRFGQHNTVLIDDSSLKANAQPYNLLQIPEFTATPEQMEGDALREVAGYLEILRHQADVSKLINKEPFNGDGRWNYEWPDEIAGGGEMTSKASAKKNKKKNKKQNAGVIERERSATPRVETEVKVTSAQSDAVSVPVAEAIDSMSSVSLAGSVQKDW